ncbi:hypothetical protein BDV93DRAFT_517829 [Ceratobasidium sp. AG-I]|nr:hypothetical protein BDV93DRAFT_517829 [Ceratobasidium sp. AG-I]
MSRSSASMSTVKGFSLTFDDLAAFANHVLYSPPAATPNVSENMGRRPSHGRTASAFLLPDPNTSRPSKGHRHSTSSTSSISSTSTSSTSPGSWYTPSQPQQRRSPTSPIANSFSPPTSPYSSRDTARPRRLTEKERAALANYTAPEMDIADMAAAYRNGGMSFEPLQ